MARAAGPDPWAIWMRDVGAQVRRVREFLDLSQVEVSRLAGVSQGAVSRFEAGRGLATPLLVAVKIHLVLTQRLREVNPEVVNDDLRRVADSDDLISPPVQGVGYQALPVAGDSELEELVRVFRELPETKRSMLQATAVALRDV